MPQTFEQVYHSLERSTCTGPEIDTLRFMEQNGSAVRIQFGRDGNEMWECDWIAKEVGMLHGTGRTPATAILSTMTDYLVWKKGRGKVVTQ